MPLKQKISREELKEKLGDENIFNYYFGKFELSKSYHSVLRPDEKKSTAFFISEKGSILYKDFSTGDVYDFVRFVMKMHNKTYREALKQISIDFDLEKGEKSKEQVAVVAAIKKNKKQDKVISVLFDEYNKLNLSYWSAYGITKQELIDNYVYPVKTFTNNGWEIPEDCNSKMRFCYLIEDPQVSKTYLKIYTPYAKDYRWLSNVPLNVPFGLSQLPFQSDTLIITKGQKDRIVLKKYFTDVIALQNESSGGLTKTLANSLKKLYKKVYIWFDTDRAGIKAANYYYKTYGFTPVFIYNENYNLWENINKIKHKKIKDPSDYVKKYGLEPFELLLKKMELI